MADRSPRGAKSAGALIMALCSGALSSESLAGGFPELTARLGAGNVPTGATIPVGQVEAPESPGNYGPAQGNGEFVGKIFTPLSGAPGSSGHATLVGQMFYGSASSYTPGITGVYLWEASSWATSGYLRTGQGAGVQPLPTPGGINVFNNSWIGTFGSAATDTDALRRADFVVSRDQLTICCGVNNGGAQNPLLCYGYNGISVGLANGTHTSGNTPAGYDGPGRQKPEIVEAGQFTSFTTPVISSTAALLRHTAKTFNGLATNVNALRSETQKAVILAGAYRSPTWTNNPAASGPTRGVTATPLDPKYGAGTANVNFSHLILTGLEQDGADTVPAASNVKNVGWDLATVGAGGTKNYRFHLPIFADSIQVLATWNRIVASNFASFTTANFTLTLQRIDSNGLPVTLVGDPGLGYFAGGNVVSQSGVDNVESLYITGLAAGDYVMQLSRIDALGGTKDVAIAWMLPKKTGDATGDGYTNIDDLLAVINAWGNCPGCPADLTGGGVVNIDDLLAVINRWG